ncbi:MAG TPA: omptin family outer membrane protease [candidate division Zixibacteria bacterium]|nr:omptin family outer membrane protease [candidate division Zixibacteria bacterium]
MKKTIVSLAFLVLMATGSVSAEATIDFQLTPSISWQSGYHDYEINFAYYALYGNDTVIVRGRSKLEFPLDGIYPTLRIGINNRFESEGFYFVEAEASLNVSDPGDAMKDSDWETNPYTHEEVLWSYSESDVEHDFIMLQGLIGRKVVKSPKGLIGVVMGFRYVKIKQDIIGLSLRQWEGSEWVNYASDGKVGHYEVTYKMPFIGARAIYKPSSMLQAQPQVLVSRLFASDLDDHVLRGKTAEGSPEGIAVIGSLAGRYEFKTRGPSTPYIELSAELLWLHATGKQVQTWYEDETYYDEAVGEDVTVEAGTKISNIPHEINNTTYRIGLGIGMNF